MASSETADSVRSFATMIRVQGPDPKGLKMRNHAFHQYHSGRTSLSASGMVLPRSLYDSVAAEKLSGVGGDCSPLLVLTVASIVEPFLSKQNTDGISMDRPEFIHGVQIDVMIENGTSLEEGYGDSDKGASRWHTARCLKLIDVPTSASALQSLVEASLSSLEHGWEVGWSLASLNRGPQSLVTQTQVHPVDSGNLYQLGKLTTRVAILGVSLFSKAATDITISPSTRKGDSILAVGSPFGILSPLHFFNSISAGSIANSYPPHSSSRSLLMADIRCLPGTEGGPVFDGQSQLIGILMRPLRQKISGAEIQLVIPWEAIATACSDFLRLEPSNNEKGFYSSSVEKAMASICLITVDDGVWASGVLINDQGLILTNAHLLEPWRFGKRSEGPFIGGEPGGHKWSSTSSRSRRKIRVRLDYREPWVWCGAKVISVGQGPLDVALLKLEPVPDQLCPITVDFSRPSVGSKAHVIGHGLFGPRCGFFPSVCSGVVAKVVHAKLPSPYQLSHEENGQSFPVMLETTAAVHPGGSGGAVVNLDGHMIGLVTSNARHGGGTVISHLNFSIPCSALLPIFKFSKDMDDHSLLEIFDQPSENLSSVWALMPPISPKPPLTSLPQSLQDDSDKNDVKGSRFAKFIAERQELLKKPDPLDLLAKKPNAIVPSKL